MHKVSKADFSQVRLLVVDLDNTLCDTFHTLSKRQWKNALDALAKDGVDAKTMAHLRKELGKRSFRSTLLGLSPARQRLALKAYDDLDVKPLRLYDDAHALLDLPIQKVLVTRGERGLQTRKITHLKIQRYFKKIYYVPTFGRKKDTFKKVLRDFRLTPKQALVIGDRIEEEILDAKQLGLPAAFIDRPDWPSHPSVETPDLSVKSLEKIADRLKKA
jgi:FMN phosphatase YigB (HAD superfamily)